MLYASLTPGARAQLAQLNERDARRLLLELGAVAALKAFDRECAQRYAAKLLMERCTRAVTRSRLIQRFGISERSAYRLIDAAICAKSAGALADNGHTLDVPNHY